MPLIYSVGGVQHAEFSAVFEEAIRKRAQPKDQGFKNEESKLVQPPSKNIYGNRMGLEPKQRRPVLRAEQIMTHPARTLKATQKMSEAETLMSERRFRHVPIVDDLGSLAGILSDRDLLRFKGNWADPIQNHMVQNVLTATADTTVAKIAQAMFENRMSSLPIVDGDHKVVGILTATDIFRALMNQAPLDLWV